jgi:hypothetical protein
MLERGADIVCCLSVLVRSLNSNSVLNLTGFCSIPLPDVTNLISLTHYSYSLKKFSQGRQCNIDGDPGAIFCIHRAERNEAYTAICRLFWSGPQYCNSRNLIALLLVDRFHFTAFT